MHSYSIDTEARKIVYVTIGVISFAVPGVGAHLVDHIRSFVASIPAGWPLSFGTTFGLLFFLYDKLAWRWRYFRWLHGIPDLNGTWSAQGVSSFKTDEHGSPAHEFSMEVVIRQTFSRLEVFTETEGSTSRSTMASICLQHANTLFRYAFENIPKSVADPSMQRHPGLMDLRLTPEGDLIGDYFSGKHRLRFGELRLKRKQR